MSIDLQIREQISLYLLGQIDASDLEAWLAEVTWDIDDEPVPVRRVAFGALRLLSETANGDWTDEELRKKLTVLLQTVSPETPSSSVRQEGFLEKLAAAEAEARNRDRDEVPVETVMGYARYASFKEASFENWQSNDRAFLRQPKGESDTPHPAAAELALG